MERGDDAMAGVQSHGCCRGDAGVRGYRTPSWRRRRGVGALTSEGGSGRRQDVDWPPCPTTRRHSREQPCASRYELASYDQGPAYRRESHADAGEHKARMETSNVRFFLWISTIFSVCRMLISLVHFLCEAATRRMAHRLGYRLHASYAFSYHRAGGAQSLAYHNCKRTEEVAMQCPVCTTGLQITERQGIDIDYCPQCRGVW